MCDRHADAFDLPIPAVVAFRRVRVMSHVDFAGTAWSAGAAHNEAVEQLQQAVAAAGGMLTLMDVGSVIGRHGDEDGPERPNGDTG